LSGLGLARRRISASTYLIGRRRIGTTVIRLRFVRRHISIKAYLFSSSTVLAIGLFRGSIMPATGLYLQAYWRGAYQLTGILARGLINLGSSMVLVAGSYSKEQSSPCIQLLLQAGQ